MPAGNMMSLSSFSTCVCLWESTYLAGRAEMLAPGPRSSGV